MVCIFATFDDCYNYVNCVEVDLPKEDGEFYQFCYLSRSKSAVRGRGAEDIVEVHGSSEPFQFIDEDFETIELSNSFPPTTTEYSADVMYRGRDVGMEAPPLCQLTYSTDYSLLSDIEIIEGGGGGGGEGGEGEGGGGAIAIVKKEEVVIETTACPVTCTAISLGDDIHPTQSGAIRTGGGDVVMDTIEAGGGDVVMDTIQGGGGDVVMDTIQTSGGSVVMDTIQGGGGDVVMDTIQTSGGGVVMDTIPADGRNVVMNTIEMVNCLIV